MPYGQSSYMSTVDFSTGYIERLTLVGAIKFCVRPPAGSPQWVLIATDAGEIRVFNNAGIHQTAYDIDLGWNPSQISINNEDPAKILIHRSSTNGIYLYEEGVESWNVTGITGLQNAVISTGYIHTLIDTGSNVTSGAEWRSLTDGSIVQAAYGVTGTGTVTILSSLCCTESGKAVFYQYVTTSAGFYYNYARKEDRTLGTLWSIEAHPGSPSSSILTPYRGACNADGSLFLHNFYDYHFASLNTEIFLRRGSDGASLHWMETSGTQKYSFNINPAGTWAIIVDGTTLYKYDALGTETTTVMGGTRAVNNWCCDVTDDPYFLCVLNNGDIEIYDSSLVLKATVTYDLSDSPIAVIPRT